MNYSPMEPMHWLPAGTASLLDVGCNTGNFLYDCQRQFPQMRLAGVDINHSAIQAAKAKVPDADLHQGYGYKLPFACQQFQCVTCIEVIEHVAASERPLLMSEMKRVLVPHGRLILRCPHAGISSWLDAQNFRFRFPRIYRAVVGEGNRDVHYEQAHEELVWHHHFTCEELIAVAGEGWRVEALHYGGLLLFPISDILRWPFYRMNKTDNWFVRALEKMATAELALSFGTSSYGILLVLTKSGPPEEHEDRLHGA